MNDLSRSVEGPVLEALLGAIEVGLWQWQPEAEVVRLDATLARAVGQDPEALSAWTLEEWRAEVHPEDRADFDRWLNQASQLGELACLGYRLRHRDGHWLEVEDRAVLQPGEAGMIAGARAVRRVSPRRSEAGKERRSGRSAFNDLAEISDAWLWAQDKDLRFRRHSRGEHSSAYRLSSQAMLGKTHAEWLDENPAVRESSDWAQVLGAQERREAFTNFVFHYPGEDGGEDRWCRISGAPIFDAEGVFEGYKGAGADITELVHARARAEEASRAKTDFLANMSHEIRTPLNGVLGMAEVLERALDAPELLQMVRIIRSSGESLLSILNDILDMSKIESGKIDLEAMPFDPAEIARRVHDVHRYVAEEKGVDFDVLIATGKHLNRIGDPLRVQQILHNLTSNALKFTESGEVLVRVSAKSDEILILEVRDTGIGMSDAQVARLGEAFHQADSSVTRRFGGTGLGLAITKKLVALMGGTLEFTSALGRGTTVRVTLPMPPGEAGEGALPLSLRGEGADLSWVRVLLADDNAINRTVLERGLQSAGASTVAAVNGLEVLQKWQPGAFDVVLLDIAMPVMGGLEALAELRKLEVEAGLPAQPILAVTANAMPHQIEEYAAAGFDAWVAKPISGVELSTKIEALVRRARDRVA